MKRLLYTLIFFFLPVVAFGACTGITVTTDKSDTITATSGTIYGTITVTGGACTITQSGFAFSTDINLVTGVATSTLGVKTSGVQFNENHTALTTGTTYYFRAYGTNSGATTAYGTKLNFVPVAPPPPSFVPPIIIWQGYW